MTIADIIRSVKIKIDEIPPNESESIEMDDNIEMSTIIRSHIKEGVRFILGNADWDMLEPDTVITDETQGIEMSIDDNLVGHLVLPDEFLRLCYAKFDSWPIYATDVIFWNDSEYATLHDPHATGTWQRPKIAVVKVPKRTLELYSAKNNKEKWVVGLITEPSIDVETDSGTVGMPTRLEPALIYYVCGLTLLTYNDKRADEFFNQATLLMGAANATTVAAVQE